ncbi:MAG TPA: flagellar basal body rod protein FlgB [Acidimicrobiales bacterium]|nr:flagellar basal body rod protein FlgB [Acidimicrobiales bacterium]
MDGGIVDVLQFAIDGLSQRQDAVANNLANANTPGYTANEVSFESSLNQALSTPDGTAQVTTTKSTNAPGTDGNNVDLSGELVAAQQTTLQYQTMTDLINAQFRLIQGAAGGSFQ